MTWGWQSACRDAGMEFPTIVAGKVVDVRSSLKWRIDHPVNVIPSVSNKIQYHKGSKSQIPLWKWILETPLPETNGKFGAFVLQQLHRFPNFYSSTQPDQRPLDSTLDFRQILGCTKSSCLKSEEISQSSNKMTKTQEKNILELFRAGKLLVVTINSHFSNIPQKINSQPSHVTLRHRFWILSIQVKKAWRLNIFTSTWGLIQIPKWLL